MLNQILTASGMVILPRDRYLTVKSDALATIKELLTIPNRKVGHLIRNALGSPHFILKPMDKTDQVDSGVVMAVPAIGSRRPTWSWYKAGR